MNAEVFWSESYRLTQFTALAAAVVPRNRRVHVGMVALPERELPAPWRWKQRTRAWPLTESSTYWSVWVANVPEPGELQSLVRSAHASGARDPFFWIPTLGLQHLLFALCEHEGLALVVGTPELPAPRALLREYGFRGSPRSHLGDLLVSRRWNL